MNKNGHEAASSQNGDSLRIKGFDYVELYVGNARQALHFYRTAFGFTQVAYAGPETGVSDRESFIMQQNGIRLVLTSAVSSDSFVAEHIARHGDGVRDIAFTVDDAHSAFQETVKRGARPVMEPTVFDNSHGCVVKATVKAFGDTVHSFIQHESPANGLLPNYYPVEHLRRCETVNLNLIDHIAICVESGRLDYWVDFYKQVFGFHQSHQEDIYTDHSGMNSKAVQNRTGEIKFPMMEPVSGKRKSQIEVFLNSYQGPGAQHIAFLCDDIAGTVRELSSNGIGFLQTPEAYYKMLPNRISNITEDIEELRELNILVDHDREGYLMQIFTKPLQSRPTVFAEIIQRKGASGFGGGNIKALFEAVEYEQAKRGNV
jgi:4-hydroxyphenylpyruvate dioxygenase